MGGIAPSCAILSLTSGVKTPAIAPSAFFEISATKICLKRSILFQRGQFLSCAWSHKEEVHPRNSGSDRCYPRLSDYPLPCTYASAGGSKPSPELRGHRDRSQSDRRRYLVRPPDMGRRRREGHQGRQGGARKALWLARCLGVRTGGGPVAYRKRHVIFSPQKILVDEKFPISSTSLVSYIPNIEPMVFVW